MSLWIVAHLNYVQSSCGFTQAKLPALWREETARVTVGRPQLTERTLSLHSPFSCRFPGRQTQNHRPRRTRGSPRRWGGWGFGEWRFPKSSSPSGAASGSAIWARSFRRKPALSPRLWFRSILQNHLFRGISPWCIVSWCVGRPEHLGFLLEWPILGRRAASGSPALQHQRSFWIKVLLAGSKKKRFKTPSQ